MLGSALFNVLNQVHNLKVFGTIRSKDSRNFFSPKISKNLIIKCDVLNYKNLVKIFDSINPDLVINCISISKILLNKSDPLIMIPIYALLPNQLSKLSKKYNSRLIQISSDGVFSGKKGNYKEYDPKDPQDIYGITKSLGEINESHVVTIRTSIIGHELDSKNGLVEWFLSQKKKECECFKNVIFSGFPTVVLAEIIRDYIIPNKNLKGVYHIASNPISKCNLLKLIIKEYGLNVKLIPNSNIKINRSLNADHFNAATGYIVPDWKDLIESMRLYKKTYLK